ncbi:MAG: phytanoyl-CoA dioxygenase family protein [Gammaproteobacteria bacterium]|tara:strand:- start:1155 stop:2045 length:891 start_codon:yes stop_codon:yes gene_type:complete
MGIKHLKANSSIEEILEVIEQDAGVIIDNLLDKNQLKNISEDLKPYLVKTKEGQDDFTGFKTKRVGALMARSAECQNLALNPIINEVSKLFFEPHSDGYQLHFTSAIDIAPGESKQIPHRDRGVWGGYIPRKIETQLSTVWAIDDFTKENGATQVVPGSHKWDRDREPKEDEICYAEMKKGSVFIYTGSVIHGGGANNSNKNRLGVFLHYAPSWLRQQENQYLSCPPHIAKDLTPELRSLMGYTKGGYVLGFYSDPEDKNGELESVSPEKMFGNFKDKYGSINSADKLVSDSSKRK